jgi:glycerate kinase
MISRTLLIVAGEFTGLSAQRVASAISRGLAGGGWPTEECPLEHAERPPAELRELLHELDLDARMRRARAVVLAERRLREDTLAASATFEIATRARQAGVPAYAVTAENTLSAFDARVLDLQVILEASRERALEEAGRQLAELV